MFCFFQDLTKAGSHNTKGFMKLSVLFLSYTWHMCSHFLFKILQIYESPLLVKCQGLLLPRCTKQMTELSNPFLFPSRTKEIITVWLLHILWLSIFSLNSFLNVLFQIWFFMQKYLLLSALPVAWKWILNAI